MLQKKSCRVERVILVVNTNTINTKKYTNINVAQPIVHTPLLSSRHSEALFVSERLTRADPRTVRLDKVLSFWATIVIQIFHILSEKFGQQSTLFDSSS